LRSLSQLGSRPPIVTKHLFHRPEDPWSLTTLNCCFGILFSGLAKNPVSDNVGGVKLLLSTLQRSLREERHFALEEEVLFQLRHIPTRLKRGHHSSSGGRKQRPLFTGPKFVTIVPKRVFGGWRDIDPRQLYKPELHLCD